MNAKLVNCLQELNELKEYENQIREIESKIENESDGNYGIRVLQKQLTETKQDLHLSIGNIIGSIPYVKIESDEDAQGIKQIADYLVNMTIVPLSEVEKSDLIQVLAQVDRKQFGEEIHNYSNEIARQNGEALSRLTETTDFVIDELHNEFKTGQSIKNCSPI